VLETLIRRLRFEQTQIRDEAQDKSQDLLDRATRLPDPGGSVGHDDILQRLGENLRDEKDIQMDWDGMKDGLTQKIQTYKAILGNVPTTTDLIASIGHKIMLLNKANPQASALARNGRFTAADALVRNYHLSGSGSELQNEVSNLFRTRRETLLNTLKTKTTPPKMDVAQFTDDKGNVLTGDAAKDAASKMAERFKVAEAAEAKRMAQAKEAYLNALKTDRAYLGMTEDTAPIKHTEIRKFGTADMLEDAKVDIHDAKTSPAAMAEAATTKLENMFDDYMSNAPGGVIPDEVFEMCSRSKDDWLKDIAASAGLTYDPENPGAIDGTLLAKIQAVAESLYKKAQEKYPNKAKFDDTNIPEQVTIGGVTYAEFKQLGEGGGGVVYLGKSATGEQIVLKAPKDFDASKPPNPGDHEDFKSESATHRAVSGGEYDPCHTNILDMKGMVLAGNGQPLIAMDLADGGDAADYTDSVGACESSGLISPVARQAMMAEEMKQVLMGMKVMQDRGMTHHDLKAANVFMTRDGTFKVADFGLSRHVESRGSAVEDIKDFSSGYQPPEFLGGGDVTQKSDTFSLGAMLHKITDAYAGRTEYEAGFSTFMSARDQKKDSSGKVTQGSSLDRLVNALLDPDPAKRPSLEAALQASFFVEMDSSGSKEDLDRLRKASASYAATVGKETRSINMQIRNAEAKIVKLERSKSDAQTLHEIEHWKRAIAERQSLKRDFQRELSIEYDTKKKEAIQKKIDDVDDNLGDLNLQKTSAERKLGKTLTASELESIDKQIEDQRKFVITKKKEIEDIHGKPEYKAVIDELAEANKAFA
jgi:serine/threonine protein kinase